MNEIISDLVGDNPTIWSWISFIANLLIVGVFVNYAVLWAKNYSDKRSKD